MKPLRTAIAATFLVTLAACGSEPTPANAPALPPVKSIKVDTDAGSNARVWDGVVEAVQQADLSAQTAGRVTVVAVDVDQRVQRGDVLVRLTAVEQQAGANTAQAQLRAAQAAASEAEGNYRRYAALSEGQYVSRAQLAQARAARDSAIAARDAARAQLAQAAQQTAYTVVRAPFSGIVSARNVEPGESIAPGQPLMSLYAPGALRIEMQVPQSDADAIRSVGRAQIRLDDGRTLDAAQVIVYPAADPQTHSTNVRVVLPDVSPAPRPGVTAKVLFPIAPGSGSTVTVPASALVQRGELSAVYVVDGDRIVLRQLRLGSRDSERVEVLAGLRGGETIAADPVAAVQALATQRAAAGARHD